MFLTISVLDFELRIIVFCENTIVGKKINIKRIFNLFIMSLSSIIITANGLQLQEVRVWVPKTFSRRRSYKETQIITLPKCPNSACALLATVVYRDHTPATRNMLYRYLLKSPSVMPKSPIILILVTPAFSRA